MLSRSLLLSLSVILFQTTQLRADTYTVINTADSGAGSFRQAILDANGHANGAAPDVIGFAIPGSGVQVIQPPSLSLPAISDPVLIDGYLQPGASANTLAVGNNAVLLINLDGSIAGQSSALGINIQTSNCTVRGLIISRWAGAGVAIGSSAGAVRGNRILGNLIGTDATGAAASSNTHGVYIASGAAGNFVGSPAAADRNLISGNSIGVLIRDAFSESNSIQNNYLGSDKSGAAALLNGADIELQGVAFTVIGGTAPGAGNVIVGGSGNGAIIELNNSGGGATIQGNFIGTNAAGSAMLGRGGVSISTLNNLIGGSVPEARNVIGGGVEIREATATNNVIQGNYIGTNAAGTAALGNGTGDAIFLLRAGSTTVKNNVLVGSGGVNIAGNGGGAAVNVVQGNYIGTNAAGSAHLPPSLSAGGGVFIQSSNNHIIGGPGAGEGNVISGFSRGVHINGGSNNLVQGNRIGTDATGTAAIPNDVGITIVNTAFSGTTATQNQIVGNVISGNGSVGVNISGADENMIQGNLIGVDATNSAALPNLSHGVQLDGANNTLIGGTASGAGNVIAFNGSSQTDPRANGVKIFSGLGNSILGNSIFGNFNRLGIDLSATNDGGLNVTQNDPGDGDTGPNNLQNFPVLTSVVTTSAGTTINGVLNAAPLSNFRLEFFANDQIDPSGHGEGQIFVGSTTITTDSDGNASFSIIVPAIIGGRRVTATATDRFGNTSEFSAAIGQLLNIATRLRVQTGDNVLIGGFIVTGTEPKKVLARGIGPSLAGFFTGFLEDPTLELFQGNSLLATNDDWKTRPDGSSQQAEIEATTIPPTNEKESALVRTLPANAGYTAIVRGKNDTTGIGVVEVYDLDTTVDSKLANISTRGLVETGNNVLIGGFIPGNGVTKVLIRGIGPTLVNAGVTDPLQDPTLELVNASGTPLATNDNWKIKSDGSSQQAEIEATTIPPNDDRESAIVASLPPGNYTAVVRGKNNAIGIAVVEVYNIQ